jgi:outer membrane protein assembly factor BamA
MSLQVENALPESGKGKPVHTLGGLLTLGRQGIAASLHLSPLRCQGSVVGPALYFKLHQSSKLSTVFPERSAHSLGVSFRDNSGKHSVSVEASTRELSPGEEAPEKTFSWPLKSAKMCTTYNFLKEERFADGGFALQRVSAELAGLLGDVSLARTEGAWWQKRPFFAGTLGLSAGFGLALPMGGATALTPFEERFHLGGADVVPGEHLPGFAAHGVGPWALKNVQLPGLSGHAAEHLGGDAKLASSVSLEWPLTQVAGVQLRGMLFGSVGTLVDRVGSSLLLDFCRQARASVGVGIGAPLPGGGLLGVSWARPVGAQPTDKQQRLQVHLSFSSML